MRKKFRKAKKNENFNVSFYFHNLEKPVYQSLFLLDFTRIKFVVN